jgi:hypothetical protein
MTCCLLTGRVSAQLPYDTLPPDSLLRDTVNTTEKYLAAQKAIAIRLPVLPLIGVEGPRAPMSRIVLDRDSLEWVLAETVSDLLQRAAGVYLWRGGGLAARPRWSTWLMVSPMCPWDPIRSEWTRRSSR